MREITSHRVNANDMLRIFATDEPGSGGANHTYSVIWDSAGKSNDFDPANTRLILRQADINFQNGPIAEAGVNGLTHEVLLAIVIDRLESFQDGPFRCVENGRALSALLDAQAWLQERTRKRVARGVEGTHTV